jgi:hypothetical protein
MNRLLQPSTHACNRVTLVKAFEILRVPAPMASRAISAQLILMNAVQTLVKMVAAVMTRSTDFHAAALSSTRAQHVQIFEPVTSLVTILASKVEPAPTRFQLGLMHRANRIVNLISMLALLTPTAML